MLDKLVLKSLAKELVAVSNVILQLELWCDSVDRLLSRSVARSLDHSLDRSLDRPFDHSIARSIARSPARSIDRSLPRLPTKTKLNDTKRH